MKLIEEFCAEEVPPGPERLARPRARLVSVIEGGRPARPEPLRRQRATRRGRLAVATATAGTAAALAVVGVVAGRTSVTPGAGQVPAGLPAGQPARAFLLAMATQAARQTAGRFYCTTEVQGDRELVGSGGRLLPRPWAAGPARVPAAAPQGFRYALTRRYQITQCTAIADVVRGPALLRYLGARPESAADARAWRRAGSPDQWRSGGGVLSADPGPASEVTDIKHGTGDFGGKNDLWLPADPARLRAVFLAHPRPGAEGRDNVIVAGALTVMNSDNVLPAVRAAAFRVLADVPGMRMRPGVTDPEGQSGTAVWQDSWIGSGLSYETTYVIIDPATGLLLASDSIAQTPVAGAAPGTVLYYSATTSAYWTNELPPHAP